MYNVAIFIPSKEIHEFKDITKLKVFIINILKMEA